MKYLASLFLVLTLHLVYAEPPVLVKNVRIVDVVDETVSEGLKDILIERNRIKRIADAGQIKTSGETTVHDANGAYIIPGLWDMHAHPDDPEVWRFDPKNDQKTLLIPQFVVHGVTGIRDMAGDMNLINEWRSKIKKGELIGPQIVAGGPLLDGPNPMWDGSVGIKDPNTVAHIADSLIESGVDFLKVYSLLPRDIYLALQKYANEKGYTVAGHVPFTVKPSEAAIAGIDCQEHFLEILKEVSSKAEEIANGTLDYGDRTSRLERTIYRRNLILDTYDKKKARKLYKLFAEKNTWHTPTISMWFKNAHYEEEVKKDAALFDYLPNYLETYWKSYEVNDHLQARLPRILDYKKKEVNKYLEIIKEMHEHGVKLLAGTDVGANPLCWPGIAVHNELKMMVQAGLTPGQALQTATINPAVYLKMENDLGTIEEGKIANMVIMPNNPLESINALDQISMVINQGMALDAEKRSEILAQIKKEVDQN